jgi:hypothetical protein
MCSELNIEELISSKSFDELSEQEKSFVQQSIGESAYRHYYLIGIQSAAILKDKSSMLEPKEENKALLLAKMKKPSGNVFLYKLPAYQVLALAAMLFVIFYFFVSHPRPSKNIETIASNQTDTVYKIIYSDLPNSVPLPEDQNENTLPLTEEKTIQSQQEPIENSEEPNNDQIAQVYSANVFKMNLQEFLQEKRTGQSLSEDSTLYKYVHTVATTL